MSGLRSKTPRPGFRRPAVVRLKLPNSLPLYRAESRSTSHIVGQEEEGHRMLGAIVKADPVRQTPRPASQAIHASAATGPSER
jgi:hypothetical protein